MRSQILCILMWRPMRAAVLAVFCLAGCDSSTQQKAESKASDSTTIQSKTPAPSEQKTGVPPIQQSVKPRGDLAKTKALYEKIDSRKPGEGGVVELREKTGILMIPGKSPSEATFDVTKASGILDLAFWVAGIPAGAIASPEACTVGFEIFLDGKSQGRKRVDRLTNQLLAIDLSGVSQLKIVVDGDGDGTSRDWLYVAVL